VEPPLFRPRATRPLPKLNDLLERLPLHGVLATSSAVVTVSRRITASALLPRLPHESRELWSHLRLLARRACRLRLPALQDGHDELEGLVALLTKELVPRHRQTSTIYAISRPSPRRASFIDSTIARASGIMKTPSVSSSESARPSAEMRTGSGAVASITMSRSPRMRHEPPPAVAGVSKGSMRTATPRTAVTRNSSSKRHRR
jgi:hypothetical protein